MTETEEEREPERLRVTEETARGRQDDREREGWEVVPASLCGASFLYLFAWHIEGCNKQNK